MGMMTARTTRVCIAAGAAVIATLFAASAAAADRPTDKDVKQLLDRINQERDRFEDQLDGKVKGSILRGPRGEVNVSRYLDDLQENVNNLKDRFKPDYAASAEVTTVLRQGSDIQRFMSTQPPDFDGRQRVESPGRQPRRAGGRVRDAVPDPGRAAGAASERRRSPEGGREPGEERGCNTRRSWTPR